MKNRELGAVVTFTIALKGEMFPFHFSWFVCFFAGRLSPPWDAHDPNMSPLKTLFFYPLTSNKNELKPLRPNFKFLSGKTNDSLGQMSQMSVAFDFSKRLISRTPDMILYFDVLPRSHNGKESSCQCRRYKRCEFNPWVRKIPGRRKWKPTPVFLPGKFCGQRSLEGHSPWGHKRVRHD